MDILQADHIIEWTRKYFEHYNMLPRDAEDLSQYIWVYHGKMIFKKED